MTPRGRFLAARLAYVAIILFATVTELHFSPDLTAAADRLARAFTPSLGWRDAIDGLRNTVLFAGLGVTWVMSSLSGRVGAEIERATLVGFGLSVTVEGLQVFSPIRTASIVDVTTNTLGAFVGALIVALFLAALHRARGARSYFGVTMFVVTGAYTLAVLCEALTPLFRSVPLPGLSGGPLDRLRGALGLALPLRLGAVPWSDLLLFAPAGFLVVMLLTERGRSARQTWPAVATAGAACAFGAELVHGMLGLSIRWEAAATHAVAVGAGAWWAKRRLAVLSQTLRGPTRALAATAAYALLLVLWGWRPFLPETDFAAIAQQLTLAHLVPLASLAQRMDVFSALHVAQQFLLFLPLGCVLAVWPLRLRGRWAHLWPAVWLAWGIEAGHLVIADRYFDVTNALISCAGLGIGWLALRRSGFAPYGETLAPLTPR
jgi:glycopeptide antibiotics resistance protein